ncbi:MAG TPA: HAMP domain-containing sensor histidine kinase [Anaeromyxobacteraceae bacterium]|nr:HAMP domain-containing sensor histidine kinase [Anaeromyxobacteraceae bacterium]
MIALRSLRGRLAVYFGVAVMATSPFYAAAAALGFWLHEQEEARERSAPSTHDEAAELRDVVLKMVVALGVTAPFVGLAAAAAGLLIAGRAVAPLREAADRARRAREGLGELLLPVRGNDADWDALARAINELLDSQRRSMTEMKAFSANAAHELRTPLTAMLGEVQVALRRERTGAEYREALQTVEGEVTHLAALVQALLTLARADSGSLAVNRVVFDATDVAREVVETAARRLRGAGRSIHLDGRVCSAVGDPLLTRRILENLVENAMLHGGPHVRLHLSGEGGRTRIVVEDDGNGLPPGVRSRVFERFNRLPGAGDGFGLGLAIAHALAEAQHGVLSLEPGTPTRFELALPTGLPERSDAVAGSGSSAA